MNKKYSRAYLTFQSTDDVFRFSQEYNGWLFQSKTGEKHFAVVEFAPVQSRRSTQRDTNEETASKDSFEGTFAADKFYHKFLATLEKKKDQPLNDPATNKEDVPKNTGKPGQTPLLAYLAEKAKKKEQKKKKLLAKKKAKGLSDTTTPVNPTATTDGKRKKKNKRKNQKKNPEFEFTHNEQEKQSTAAALPPKNRRKPKPSKPPRQ